MGLVVRSAEFLDFLARSRTYFFDKTGTLSPFELQVARLVIRPGYEAEQEVLLAQIYQLEQSFHHPLADALCRWIKDRLPESQIDSLSPAGIEAKLVPGKGVKGKFTMPSLVESSSRSGGGFPGQPSGQQAELFVGVLEDEPAWLQKDGELDFPGRRIGVYRDGMALAVFCLEEVLLDVVPQLFEDLQKLDISSEILTGDPRPAWESIQGVPIRGALTPEDKVEAVQSAQNQGQRPVFVGDGINDAAAMSEASGSIVVETGSRLTLATGSAILIGNRLNQIPRAIHLARKIRRRLGSNLKFAAVYNVVGMGLAAAGILHPVVAALLMVGSSTWVSTRAALVDIESQ